MNGPNAIFYCQLCGWQTDGNPELNREGQPRCGRCGAVPLRRMEPLGLVDEVEVIAEVKTSLPSQPPESPKPEPQAEALAELADEAADIGNEWRLRRDEYARQVEELDRRRTELIQRWQAASEWVKMYEKMEALCKDQRSVIMPF